MNKADTEAMIQNLGKALPAVKPVSTGRRAALGLIAFVFYLTLLLLSAFSPRENPRGEISIVFAAALAVGCLGLLYMRQSILGAPRWRREKTFTCAAWLGALIYLLSTLYYSLSFSLVFSPQKADLACAFLISLLSLPLWAIAIWAGPYLMPTGKRYELGVTFFAFSAGALAVNAHCPLEGHGHHFLGHGVEAFVLAGLVYFVLAPLARKLTRKRIATRVNELKKRITRRT